MPSSCSETSDAVEDDDDDDDDNGDSDGGGDEDEVIGDGWRFRFWNVSADCPIIATEITFLFVVSSLL